MPLDRLVLIFVVVFVAFGATIWLVATAMAAFAVPFGGLAFVPAIAVGYIAWRVVVERLRNAEDDHYDRME